MTNRHLRLVEEKAAAPDGAPLIRVAGLEKRFTSRHGEDVVALKIGRASCRERV